MDGFTKFMVSHMIFVAWVTMGLFFFIPSIPAKWVAEFNIELEKATAKQPEDK